MLRNLLFLLLSGMLVLSCSSNGGTADAAEDGTTNGEDGDGATGDGTTGDDGISGGDDEGVLECVPDVSKCPLDKNCLCCGSLGPQETCICTIQCRLDEDCLGSGFSLCNKGEGAKSGICTPLDFFCCWNCN